MKFAKFYLVFTLFIACLVHAQDLYFKQLPLLFHESATNQPVLIDGDSLIIKPNKNERIPLKKTKYPASLNQYLPFNIKNKTYFVHNGCGPVLEFRNDSIVRIDKSFMHRNQFGAASFVYNNEIYFFGGYGLFTCKNILIKYNFKRKEWVEVKCIGDELPFVSFPYYRVENNILYIFGGRKYNEEINKKWVYQLDLKTFKCVKLKSEVLDSYINNKSRNSTDPSSFLNLKSLFYSFSFSSNKLVKYDNFYSNRMYFSFQKRDTLFSVFSVSELNNNYNFKYEKLPLQFILKNKVSEEPIYSSIKQQKWLYVSIVLLFFIVFLFYQKRMYLQYLKKPSIPFVYNVKLNQLYFRGNKVNTVSDADIKIFNMIASYNNQYIPLNLFNDLFTIDYDTENYSAIVKRREKKLENFTKLLITVSGFDPQKIFKERKNAKDKRLKEIALLHNQIRFI